MATERDPVCGMQIDTTEAAGQSDFGGKTFYFCSADCKEKFDANPQQFAQEKSGTAGGGA